ncbi:TIGR00701 family protein, partial [Mesorhizobium sp. M2C.T.Ca.TU.002.02.1.1]
MNNVSNENSTGQAMKRMVIGIAVLVVLTALLYFVAGEGFYPWAKA